MAPRIVFVIGAPGSGKGTLCKRLAADFAYIHLSIGDHLRNLVKSEHSLLSQRAIQRIHNNELLDIVDLAPILKSAVDAYENSDTPLVLIDGFPRDVDQAEHVERSFGHAQLVLYFDCPMEIAKQRYLFRALEGRNTSVDVFDKRYGEFERLNGAIVHKYATEGKLCRIDSSGATDVSYSRLLEVLCKYLPEVKAHGKVSV